MSSKDEQECPKRQQILNVTLELLKTEDFEEITVRKIAKRGQRQCGIN